MPQGRWRRLSGVLLGVVLGFLTGLAMGPQVIAPRRQVLAAPASATLRQENATLQQLQAIDREAQATLREQIATLTAQNGELNRRLALMSGVLLPDGQASELGVADLVLIPQADGTRFGYRLLLARVAPTATDAQLAGRIQLWIAGVSDEQPRDIRVAEPRLALQRLQALSGMIVLPAGFRPQRLRVVLEPNGQAPLPFEFGWQELIAASQPMKAVTPLP